MCVLTLQQTSFSKGHPWALAPSKQTFRNVACNTITSEQKGKDFKTSKKASCCLPDFEVCGSPE